MERKKTDLDKIIGILYYHQYNISDGYINHIPTRDAAGVENLLKKIANEIIQSLEKDKVTVENSV
jgi:hypothetical protein